MLRPPQAKHWAPRIALGSGAVRATLVMAWTVGIPAGDRFSCQCILAFSKRGHESDVGMYVLPTCATGEMLAYIAVLEG
jgi:hypothetical protein